MILITGGGGGEIVNKREYLPRKNHGVIRLYELRNEIFWYEGHPPSSSPKSVVGRSQYTVID